MKKRREIFREKRRASQNVRKKISRFIEITFDAITRKT